MQDLLSNPAVRGGGVFVLVAWLGGIGDDLRLFFEFEAFKD